MSEINFTAKSDFLRGLARSMKKGLSELVWNALDADAQHVSISIDRNKLGGIDSVKVSDDGTGLAQDGIDVLFGSLGGSWKGNTDHTASGRTLHGQKGQGRFAAYSIGSQIVWDSTFYKSGQKTLSRTIISGDRANSNRFTTSDAQPVGNATGTIVTVTNILENNLRYLENRDKIIDDLAIEFAPYLAVYKATLSLDGNEINPKTLATTVTLKVPITYENTTEEIDLEVWQWQSPVQRRLYLCDEGGVPLYDMPPKIRSNGVDFTAYAKWRRFKDNQATISLESMAESPVPEALEAIKSTLSSFFLDRMNEQNTQLIDT